MKKKEHYQIVAIMLVSILVVATVAYVATLQQPNPTIITTYPVKNFDSYHALTSFLQASNENTAWTDNRYAAGIISDSSNIEIAPSVVKETEGGQSVDYSTTNVQVAGVDEPDIVKTDGTYLYIVSNNTVVIVKAYPAENASIETIVTVGENLTIRNVFISGTRLVIFSESSVNYPILYSDVMSKENVYISSTPWYSSPDTHISIYRLDTITAPEPVKEVIIGGSFSDARLIGEYVYVITTQYTYNTQGNGENFTIVPRISVNGQALDVYLDDIFYVDSPDMSSTLTNVVSVNIHNDVEQIHAKIFLLGTSQIIYVSQNNIYVTYSTWYYYDYTKLQQLLDDILMPVLPGTIISQLDTIKTLDLEDYQKQEIVFWILQNYAENSMPEEQKTQIIKEIVRQTEQTIIHRISISNGTITYEGQGSIPGYVNNQFSFDEYNGYLRVSTTIQGSSVSNIFGGISPETNLYVLDMQLTVVGSLEDITPGTGESIYATRFIGTTCYMVTFMQTDPFMVIDLSIPTSPVLLGELKIPGYSTYLHPFDDTHMIGIGRNSSAVKIALYDISDMNNPVEVGLYTIENKDPDSYWWTESAALYEHKAFLFSKDKQLLVIPAGNYSQQSAYVFSISLENGINLKGVVTHELETQPQEPYYYWWGTSANSIKRSLYIENTLYTVSENMVKMNDLTSLADLNSITLFST